MSQRHPNSDCISYSPFKWYSISVIFKLTEAFGLATFNSTRSIVGTVNTEQECEIDLILTNTCFAKIESRGFARAPRNQFSFGRIVLQLRLFQILLDVEEGKAAMLIPTFNASLCSLAVPLLAFCPSRRD